MSPRYLLFLFLALFMFPSKPQILAQDVNYTHYTVESGLQLPSNEVYGIVFDQDNVLWATTERGVWRYDGYTARQFTVTDGLKENANLKIFLESGGRIWVTSISNYLYEISGDSIREHPLSRMISKKAIPSAFIQHVTENHDGSIYLSFNRPGLFRFAQGESPQAINNQRINHNQASIAIHYTPGNYYWDQFGIPDPERHTESLASVDQEWTYIQCETNDPKNNFRKDLFPIGDKEFIFSYAKKVFHVRDGQIITEQTFQHDIIDIYADKKGSFWVGLEVEGAQQFLNGDLTSEPVRYLRGETVTGITQDHEGNYWFSTTTNGIFQTNNLNISVFEISSLNEKDNVMMAMATDGENIYLGTQTGLLFKGREKQNNNYEFTRLENVPVDGPIRKLVVTPEKHLIIYNTCLYETDTLGRPRGIKKIRYYPYSYYRTPQGEWLASFATFVYVIRNDRIVKNWDVTNLLANDPADSVLIPMLNRIRSMEQDKAGRVWIGSQKGGLYSFRDTVYYSWAERDTLFGKRIQTVVSVGENIWTSIADYGIAVIKPDSTFLRITQQQGLSSDIIDVLFPENDSVVWAGTNNGLNRITLKKGSEKPDNIAYYTMREGLPSNRIYQILKHKNNIWIATTHGAIRLNPGFNTPVEMNPILDAGPLEVNGKPRDLKDYMVLKPQENNLVFKFKAITYRKPSTLQYRYRLIGLDKDYIVTSNIESRYPDLTFGDYIFCINASYNSVFTPETEQTFHVQIRRHWFETRIAYIFYFLAITGATFLGFRMVLKSTKKRELDKRQLLQAEKRSLLSQMNPHFIFNSLNSIQHFIIQNDQYQANNYLASFSGLIRRILENSKKNLIPLHEEISSLSLYLSMEKLRFENEFDYKIVKDNSIDYHETMIPPMLLQPFVENAIWHGLMPLKSKGLLTISFGENDGFFHCSIEDNGIGRLSASKIKTKKEPHLSTGILNVQERIELLNKMNKKKISLLITDLHLPDGKASGTLVEIILPIDLKS